MLNGARRLKDYVMCASALGVGFQGKWSIMWSETKNLRVRLGFSKHHPKETYCLSTVYGPLYFRDNFGDITNFVKLFYNQEYRVRQLKQPGAIVDIGANIGLAAAWFANHNPDRPICCFEPLAANIALIHLNCPRAEVHEVVVGSRRGRLKLRVDADEVMASKIPCRWDTRMAEFEVVPLDAIGSLKTLDRVALLKIDVEGMEIEVLEGASQTLNKTSQVILETHGRSNHETVNSILVNHGFLIESETFSEATGLVFAGRH